MMRRRNIPTKATFRKSIALWEIKFPRGSYYFVRMTDAGPILLTGAKKMPASEKMVGKLLPKALAAIEAAKADR